MSQQFHRYSRPPQLLASGAGLESIYGIESSHELIIYNAARTQVDDKGTVVIWGRSCPDRGGYRSPTAPHSFHIRLARSPPFGTSRVSPHHRYHRACPPSASVAVLEPLNRAASVRDRGRSLGVLRAAVGCQVRAHSLYVPNDDSNSPTSTLLRSNRRRVHVRSASALQGSPLSFRTTLAPTSSLCSMIQND